MISNKNRKDFEVIVIDNASTDKTKKIAKSFKGVKVYTEKRKGTNFARNLGLKKSSGILIANIDADSTLNKKWLDTVLYEFENKPYLVALSGPCKFFDLPLYSNLLISLYYYLIHPFYIISNKLFGTGGLIMGGNLVVKREALIKAGGYNQNLTFHGDDFDTAARLSKVGEILFNYKLTINTSGRRIRGEGLLKSSYKYLVNHFWMFIFQKPIHTNSIHYEK